MPMKFSTRVVSALLTNIPMAIVMSLVATYLGMKDAPIPPEAFAGAYLGSAARGMGISYLLAVVIGILLPLPKWAMGIVSKTGLTPASGLKFSAAVTALINVVYCVVLSSVLSYVNVVVINGAPLPAFFMSLLTSIIPCYLVSYVISFLWAQRAEGIARRICNDPAPAMGPGRGQPGR